LTFILTDKHHYLGYCHPVGEHLKYLVFANDRPVACLSWSSVPRHKSSRDTFIAWSADIRKKNLCLIAYYNRFLIPCQVRIPNLATHILGRIAKILPSDWKLIYNHPIYFIETFVDTERFSQHVPDTNEGHDDWIDWTYLVKVTQELAQNYFDLCNSLRVPSGRHICYIKVHIPLCCYKYVVQL